jgi:hypothetical protein
MKMERPNKGEVREDVKRREMNEEEQSLVIWGRDGNRERKRETGRMVH